MSEKRYFIARGDGDYGIYYSCDDNNCICVCDVERIAENTCDRLNEQDKRIKELEKEKEHIETCFKMADSTYHILRKQYHNIEIALSKYRKENEKLKKELFEARKDYLIETYSDNPTRRDEKIQGLKEEFKERFGDVE